MAGEKPLPERDTGRRDNFDDSAVPAQRPVVANIGFIGWLRWGWRQLTSMRVALMLLMALALASVPGSILPQRNQDPNGVLQFYRDNPQLAEWFQRLGLFEVFAAPWFTAIYVLLMISLIGCIIPRISVHVRSLRRPPPRVPRRFTRFPVHETREVSAGVDDVIEAARKHLRGGLVPRFRVATESADDGPRGLSAERGYLRETGNIAFHLGLVGLLIAVATGQMFHYRAQIIVVEDTGFANSVVDFHSFDRGALFDDEGLSPFTVTLDRFESEFTREALARDFRAYVTVEEPDGSVWEDVIRVNHPLHVDGTKVYLMGNGYAPQITVHDSDGNVAFEGTVPFLPQDGMYTSRGVVKVPDVTSGPQIGLQGYFLPTAYITDIGAESLHPDPMNPFIIFTVYAGDLGLDDGIPQNVYQLDTDDMEQLDDEETGLASTLLLAPGDTVDLPDGLGAVTFEGFSRYIAVDLRHDPALTWILVFSVVASLGLMVSLFTPRRRVWVKATPSSDGGTSLEVAGLARGDDLHLATEVDRLLVAITGESDAEPPIDANEETSDDDR